MRELRRMPYPEEALGGVCAGIAYSVGIPTWTIRLAFLVGVIFYGFGVLPYVLLWIVLPSWDKVPKDYRKVTCS